jgi:hypothetical protein
MKCYLTLSHHIRHIAIEQVATVLDMALLHEGCMTFHVTVPFCHTPYNPTEVMPPFSIGR